MRVVWSSIDRHESFSAIHCKYDIPRSLHEKNHCLHYTGHKISATPDLLIEYIYTCCKCDNNYKGIPEGSSVTLFDLSNMILCTGLLHRNRYEEREDNDYTYSIRIVDGIEQIIYQRWKVESLLRLLFGKTITDCKVVKHDREESDYEESDYKDDLQITLSDGTRIYSCHLGKNGIGIYVNDVIVNG